MYPTPNAGTSKASQAFWQVNDVEAEVAELKARGVVFEEYDMPGIKMKNSIATGGGAKTAWFKDSEGNIMAVSQRLRQLVGQSHAPPRAPLPAPCAAPATPGAPGAGPPPPAH